MNKFVQNFLLLLMPFYPLWAFAWVTLTHTPFSLAIGALLLPIALYLLIFNWKSLPRYIIFFSLFAVYHVVSLFITNTFPENSSKIYFILSDQNVLAVLFFIIIEHTIFDSKFLINLTKLLLVTLVLSLIVSVIQIKIPTFFFNVALDPDSGYLDESRCASIFSWTNLNSLGISFPLIVAILVNIFHGKKPILFLIAVSGIVVSFLSKARYVMISSIIALSQLFLNTKTSVVKKVSLIAILAGGILFANLAAENLGFNVNDVVESRILEKDNDMGSAKARLKSYEVFLIAFPENPWFGVGPETRKDVVDMLDGTAPLIHIGYLSYLYFYGVVGFLLLAAGIFYLLKYAWNIGKRHNFWGAFYGILSICIANATLVYFNFAEMGVALAVIYLRYFSFKSIADLYESLKQKSGSPDNSSQSLETINSGR